MASFSFGEVIKSMQEIGVFDYILPFLLVFAIIFAILEKTKVLGADKTNINGLVSFVIGLILIAQQSVVQMITTFLPRFSLILVVAMAVLILVAFLAGDKFKGLKGSWFFFFVLIGIIAMAFSLFDGSGLVDWFSDQDSETVLIISVSVIVIGVVWAFISGGKRGENEDGKMTKLFKSLDNSLKD